MTHDGQKNKRNKNDRERNLYKSLLKQQQTWHPDKLTHYLQSSKKNMFLGKRTRGKWHFFMDFIVVNGGNKFRL